MPFYYSGGSYFFQTPPFITPDPPITDVKLFQFTCDPGGVVIKTNINAKKRIDITIGTKKRLKYTSLIAGSIYIVMRKFSHYIVSIWPLLFSVRRH